MDRSARLIMGIFEDKCFFQKMLILAVPVMIQNFIASFLNMVDTVMVGRLGEVEIAAVGIANQYFFFYNMFLIGLSAGCSVFISQFWGKKDYKNIKRILGIGLISATIVALIFGIIGFLEPTRIIALFNDDPQVIDLGAKYLKIAVVSYLFTGITFIYSFSLRSIGNALQPMLISIVALICNVILNYTLIFGNFGAPALGVEGAAIATVTARVVETIVLVGSVYLGKGVLTASLKELTDLTFAFWKQSYRTIFPVILNDICWGLATLVYVAVYGRIGFQAVATIQICNTVNQLFMVVTFGLSSAAAVMIGNSIGAGKEGLAKDYAQKFSGLAIVVGIVLGAILALTSPLILNFFNVSYTVRNHAQIILYMISAIFFMRVLGIMLIVGVLRGGGDAGTAFLIEGFTMWFVGVPLTILGALVFQFPVYIVFGLAIIEEFCKCILSLMRLRSGKWIKNVTHNMA